MKSNFTAIFSLIIMMLVGIALLPLVDIGSQPRERQGKTLNISFSWPNGAAHVIEQNVTSRIEGIVSAVKGVAEVSSESRYGSGSITIELKPGVNPSVVKFEIASMLKQLRQKFPKEVSYPTLSGGDVVTGEKKANEQKLLLTYLIGSEMPVRKLKELIKMCVESVLMKNEDILRVELIGGTDQYLDIIYDPQKLQSAGVTAYDIEEGIKSFIGRDDIVGDVLYKSNKGKQRICLSLTTEAFEKSLEQMPIVALKNSDGTNQKTVYLNDLASYEYKNREPNNFFRVNGLETVYLNVYVSARSNMIKLSEELRNKIETLEPELPKGVNLELAFDGAEKEQGQLYRLITRSITSILILLLFVWLVSRSLKYLAIVTITLIADVLISVMAYNFFDIRLHIFSLAGITVSLGFVIDASIVMIDYYSYYRDRKVFLSILAALLTTIGSLVLIYFMPDYIQRDLSDFAWIVIINLCSALLVSFLFIPALVEEFHYFKSEEVSRVRYRKGIVRFSRFYSNYILFTQKRKWIYIMLLVLAFGLPTYLIPSDNSSVARWKESLTHWLGGTMNLFAESLDTNTYKREEPEMQLNIRARMPQGGTAADLNEKVKILEDFLRKEDGIRRWETTVSSWGAYIAVFFTKEALATSAPYMIENRVIGKVIGIGGAEWSTYGVSQRGFSNSLSLQYRSNSIEIAGYNYDQLNRYAEEIECTLHKNPRVVDVVIETPGYENQEDEYYAVYNMEKVAILEIDLRVLHNAVKEFVSSRNIGLFDDGNIKAEMQLTSSRINDMDMWKLLNSYIRINNQSIMLGDVMQIKKREAKNIIPRKNQEYVLRVAFNILGSYSYIDKYLKEITEEINGQLPPGYRCVNATYGSYEDTGSQYWLLLIVVTIIFFICSILFESLRQPFVIISLIPTSMIGTFLTFFFSKVPFGTGGFASMVLLCGLVVNAGIYILSEYDNIRERKRMEIGRKIHVLLYVKAYNHKIIPILLTILSTILGLLPFFWDNAEDKFWFSFAVGTTGGLLFSIIALVLFMPIFLNMNKINKK